MLAVIYMTIEAVKTVELKITIIRGILVGLGAIFLGVLHRKVMGGDKFQTLVCLVVFLGGVAKTFIIDQSGEFGQTFFQLGILMVLRIKFSYALALSLLDFTIFCVYTKIQNSEVSQGFFIYILFVLGYAASACYSLQMAMRQDYLQDRKLTMEQKRAEAILANLMPPHIMEAFKQKKQEALVKASSEGGPDTDSIGRKEESVSVLFCDIMDFSQLAAEVSPTPCAGSLDWVIRVCVRVRVAALPQATRAPARLHLFHVRPAVQEAQRHQDGNGRQDLHGCRGLECEPLRCPVPRSTLAHAACCWLSCVPRVQPATRKRWCALD